MTDVLRGRFEDTVREDTERARERMKRTLVRPASYNCERGWGMSAMNSGESVK
jgi:hypothetical protein